MHKKIIPLVLLSPFFLAGCLEGPGAGLTDGSIPNLTIECSSAVVFSPYCRGNGDRVWIGITNNFDLDCASVLSSFSGDSRNSNFVAISESSSFTHTGGLSRATIASWLTSNGSAIGTLTSGSYKACAFIEATGGNDRLNDDEPLGAAIVSVGGSSPQLVNDWISY